MASVSSTDELMAALGSAEEAVALEAAASALLNRLRVGEEMEREMVALALSAAGSAAVPALLPPALLSAAARPAASGVDLSTITIIKIQWSLLKSFWSITHFDHLYNLSIALIIISIDNDTLCSFVDETMGFWGNHDHMVIYTLEV